MHALPTETDHVSGPTAADPDMSPVDRTSDLDTGDLPPRLAPPAPCAPAIDPFDAIQARLADQLHELAALRDEVGRFHQRAGAQESVIDRMQKRIEELQADQVRALLSPVATELATLHGELTEIAARAGQLPPPETLERELSLLTHRVETALERLGMESAAAAPGVAFDRRWHAAVRRVPTDARERDQTIAAVFRQGFSPEGASRATVMARVTVYQYDPELALGPADLTEAELTNG